MRTGTPPRLEAAWQALRLWLGATLLPAQCALCGIGCPQVLCPPCRAQYLGQARRRCRQCANPLDGNDVAQLCGRCLRQRPAYDATITAFDYAAPVDQLLLQLKFGARLALAPLLAELLHVAIQQQNEWERPQLLCPVPLGPARLAERGYNQALEVARPLARLLDIPLQSRLALRVRETRAQSGVATQERQANLAHAFAIAPDYAPLLPGCHVGIVDDVMSSGHTVNALAAACKGAGAARVSILVVARTPPH
ncbi:ComF family protein [Janthinobacterium sp. GW460P]|uniref:phosphoribosyltransferase family protein n=1 Tax=unclassified Janthinobacterium TaxID=2610881 RepID=UPI000A3222CE|nr:MULTISPECIES: phosphoribosyltransferase family protein [unclassified Janthinobacterium]MCC7704429.1 ComF family protein [Janthinobacterium sp. GW460P]MCC7709931.1 ComF family protein [Janthinobacterium sp. GW460W]